MSRRIASSGPAKSDLHGRHGNVARSHSVDLFVSYRANVDKVRICDIDQPLKTNWFGVPMNKESILLSASACAGALLVASLCAGCSSKARDFTLDAEAAGGSAGATGHHGGSAGSGAKVDGGAWADSAVALARSSAGGDMHDGSAADDPSTGADADNGPGGDLGVGGASNGDGGRSGADSGVSDGSSNWGGQSPGIDAGSTSGGTTGAGGAVNAGGSPGAGGATHAGGSPGTGGATHAGGSPGTGGAVITPYVTQLALGDEHSCALVSDGTVKCWGGNRYSQLGDRTTQDRYTAGAVYGLSNVKQIAAGSTTTCALLNDKTVKCWGDNSLGQLGDGTQDSRVSPAVVSNINTAIDVATDGGTSCALLENHSVACWGSNNLTGLGTSGTSSLQPTIVSGTGQVQKLELGEGWACGIQADGTVKSWGQGWFGGDTSTTSAGVVTLPNLSQVKQIAVAYYVACALLTDDTVKCWGANMHGEIGQGPDNSSVGYYSSPTLVTPLFATQVAVGGAHVCVLVEQDQSIKCWGRDGQQFEHDYGPTPVTVNTGGQALYLSVGYAHNCVILADHSVKCWGVGIVGQLGNSTNQNSATPVSVVGLP